jgi:O-antigen/teichoic acid export membrane protein
MSHRRKILKGSVSNVLRIIISMAIAMVLPPLLVHRLQPAEYGAWVLILQCSGYITLLDFGLQTAVGKFVAEYDAVNDRQSSSRVLSSSFLILLISGLIGAAVISVITWRVPQLFHQMPVYLVGDVRLGILIIGLSTAILLPFGAFSAVFTGLQRYGFPTLLSIVCKILSSAGIAALLLMHGKLVQLCWVIGAFNLVAAVGQFIGWKRYASDRLDFGWRMADRAISSRLVKYGGILSIWLIAGLLVSGLDMVIIGHYDFKNAGYYGIAAAVSNFVLLIIGGVFNPLVPAVSSLQAGENRLKVGELTLRSTRYCSLLLCLFGLPLSFGAYPLLKLWLGHEYAIHSAIFLQMLILGNAIRQLALPYSLAVVATGKQHLATIAGVAEALTNICLSLYLVQRVGAIGVAIGTVVGACVSLALHLGLSMKYTQSAIRVSRRSFVLEGLARPLSCTLPALFAIPVWNSSATLPWSAPLLIVLCMTTVFIAWQIGLMPGDRSQLREMLSRWTRRGYASLIRCE